METDGESGVTSLFFPTLEELGLFEESRLRKPASEWSIMKIGSLQAKIEAFKASRKHRSSLFADDVPLHKLISFANETFGHDGWSTEVLEVTILDDKTVVEKNVHDEDVCYSYTVESKVRLILKDGTIHEDIGIGRGERLRVKSMALSKSKKESITNGIKCAFESICQILLQHEQRLRTGYYVDSYEDAFA